jgi:hypothetical protein
MRLVARTRKWKQKKQKNRRLAGAKDQIEVQTISRTPNKLRINFPYKILVEAWLNHPTSERCHRRSSSSMGSLHIEQLLEGDAWINFRVSRRLVPEFAGVVGGGGGGSGFIYTSVPYPSCPIRLALDRSDDGVRD